MNFSTDQIFTKFFQRSASSAVPTLVACFMGTSAPIVGVPAVGLPLTLSAAAAAPDYESVSTSSLTTVALPKGAVRLNPGSVPESVNDLLKSLVKAGGEGIRQGKVEVLAWTGNDFKESNLKAMREKVGSGL